MPKPFIFMRDFKIAYLRWQLLRRNEHYLAACQKFSAKHPGFPENMAYLKAEPLKRALKDAENFSINWGCPPANPDTVICPFLEVPIDPAAIIPVYDEEVGSLQFSIPIRMPTKAIQRWVTYWVGHFKGNASMDKDIARKRLQDIKLAVRVHDLKKKGKKYKEIAEELNLDPKRLGTGKDRAKNLFSTAKTWIKRAEIKSLWLDASWMFDSIIVQHQRGLLPTPLTEPRKKRI